MALVGVELETLVFEPDAQTTRPKNVKKRKNTRLEKCYGHVNIATAFFLSCRIYLSNLLNLQSDQIRLFCHRDVLCVLLRRCVIIGYFQNSCFNCARKMIGGKV